LKEEEESLKLLPFKVGWKTLPRKREPFSLHKGSAKRRCANQQQGKYSKKRLREQRKKWYNEKINPKILIIVKNVSSSMKKESVAERSRLH